MTDTGAAPSGGVSGYGGGDLGAAVSVEQVARESASLIERGVARETLDELAAGDDFVSVQGLVAGYGRMEILHGVDLQVGRGQSLCLIGPNGAGKSTVLHSIYGLTTIMGGTIRKEGRDITRMRATDKLRAAGIAYILQDNSVFPDMTVEENLQMGAYLMSDKAAVRPPSAACSTGIRASPSGARSRRACCRAASAACWRSRAPWSWIRTCCWWTSRPSVWSRASSTWCSRCWPICATTTARRSSWSSRTPARGWRSADIGYVLVSGELALAARGDELLQDERVGRLFLGG